MLLVAATGVLIGVIGLQQIALGSPATVVGIDVGTSGNGVGPGESGTQCILANHYQFFRELLLALDGGGQFVLLHDERSPTFCFHGSHGDYGLMPLLLEMLPDDIRRRVGIVGIQRVAEHIKASGRHPWIGQFEAKYAL